MDENLKKWLEFYYGTSDVSGSKITTSLAVRKYDITYGRRERNKVERAMNKRILDYAQAQGITVNPSGYHDEALDHLTEELQHLHDEAESASWTVSESDLLKTASMRLDPYLKDMKQRPALLFGGVREDVLTDGYMMLIGHGAKDILSKFAYSKQGLSLAEEATKSGVDKQVSESYFPNYKELIPAKSDWSGELRVVGMGVSVHGPLAYLTDGENLVAVNADRFAWLRSRLPGAEIYGSIAKGTGKLSPGAPLTFVLDGEAAGVLMPMFVGKMPQKLLDAAKSGKSLSSTAESRTLELPAPLGEMMGKAKAPDKEPWQMTQSEWLALQKIKPYPRSSHQKRRNALKLHRGIIEEAAKSGKKVPDSVLAAYPDIAVQYFGWESRELSGMSMRVEPIAMKPATAAEKIAKEPWQMTFSEFVQSESLRGKGGWTTEGRNVARDHEMLVRQALSEGKPVPSEVLKDYPDLQVVIAKKEAATPATKRKRRETLVDAYMNEIVTYGGFPMRRGDVIADLDEVAKSQDLKDWLRLRDAALMGIDQRERRDPTDQSTKPLSLAEFRAFVRNSEPTEKEGRVRQKLDVAEVGRVTAQLSYVPGLPFQGREHHVIISELAKSGWRFIGDSRDKKPDLFLIKEYGLKDVHRATIPLVDGGSYTVWVGRPTNEAGEKELRRLYTDKLPWIPQETLPPDIAESYVESKDVTEREQADRQRADDERLMAQGSESAKSYTEDKLREALAAARDTLKRKYVSDYDKHMKPMEIEVVLGELLRRGLSEKPSRKKKVEVATETSLQSGKHKVTLSVRPCVRGETKGWLVAGKDGFGRSHSAFFTRDREAEARELVRRVKAGEDSNTVGDEIIGRRRKANITTELQSVESSRSDLSRLADERQEHSLIIEPDDPRAKRWRKDHGSMDVRGVDTPKHKMTKKPRRRSGLSATTVVGRVRR